MAQTQVPSAKFYPLVVNSPATIAGSYRNTATVDWAPIGSGFTGDVVFLGRGCPDTYLGNPSGKVALITRGACAVSLKSTARPRPAPSEYSSPWPTRQIRSASPSVGGSRSCRR